MTKIVKAVGMIALLLIIYYIAQAFVALTFGIVHIVSQAVSAAGAGLQLDVEALMSDLMNFVSAQTPWIVLLAVLITIPTYWLLYQNRRRELLTFTSFRSIGFIGVPVLLLFGLSLNVVIEVLLTFVSQIAAFSEFFESYNQVSEVIFSGNFVMTLLAVGIIGPIFEELLFRGLVFGELRKISHVRVAIVIQALLFGIYHLNVIQGSYAFFIGLLLGFVYYRSNSILAPILIHIAVNASSVIVSEFVTLDQLANVGGIVVIAGIALFFLTGAFILSSRNFKRSMEKRLVFQSLEPDVTDPGTPGDDSGSSGAS